MNQDIRDNIKRVLRESLLGKENIDFRLMISEKLNISDSTIRSWTTINNNAIPVADDIPTICEILKITLYELYGIKDPTNLSLEDKLLLKKINNNPSLKEVVLNMKD